MHAGAGDIKMLSRKLCVEMPFVVGGKGQAQFGNTSLPRIECLTIGETITGSVPDKIGCRQITFAGPQRNDTFLTPAVIHYGNDAALWRNRCLMTQMLEKTHPGTPLNIVKGVAQWGRCWHAYICDVSISSNDGPARCSGVTTSICL